MSEITKCPKCGSEYVYFDGSLYVCPECAHEFSADDHAAANEGPEVAKDSNITLITQIWDNYHLNKKFNFVINGLPINNE